MATTATIPNDIKNALKKFRTGSSPMVLYINRKTDPPTVALDETVIDEDEEFSIESLAAGMSQLPDYAPRYIVLSYKPTTEEFPKVVLIDWIPRGCETVASMFHVGTLPEIERLTRSPKVIQINDGEEGLTAEILDAKLRR